MALDERRAKFKVSRWKRNDKKGQMQDWAIATGNGVSTEKPQQDGLLRRVSHKVNGQVHGMARKSSTVSQSEKSVSEEPESEAEKQVRLARRGKQTDVLEVWFMGCHADVGGGAVKNEERHMLSRIPLRWMLRQCFDCDTGILFDTHALAEVGLDVHTLWPVYRHLPKPVVGPSPSMMEKYETGDLGPIARRSRALKSVAEKSDVDEHDEKKHSPLGDWTPEQVEDYFDAMSSINDQLEQAKGWWILELWPIKVRLQLSDSDDWIKKVRMNLGRFRAVTETDPNVHWTALQRIQDKGYKVRTRFDRNAVWQVVT